jgi:hypothetical protein
LGTTMQTAALALVAAKLRASLMAEGELPVEGLAALEGDRSAVVLALARRLVQPAPPRIAFARSALCRGAPARLSGEDLLVDDDWDAGSSPGGVGRRPTARVPSWYRATRPPRGPATEGALCPTARDTHASGPRPPPMRTRSRHSCSRSANLLVGPTSSRPPGNPPVGNAHVAWRQLVPVAFPAQRLLERKLQPFGETATQR